MDAEKFRRQLMRKDAQKNQHTPLPVLGVYEIPCPFQDTYVMTVFSMVVIEYTMSIN
jgi:hypothetical protein